MTDRDPYLYDVELLRAKERLLEQFELFPERNYPPVPPKEVQPEAVPRRKAKAGVARVRKVRPRRKPS